jgi:hypothetical protein
MRPEIFTSALPSVSSGMACGGQEVPLNLTYLEDTYTTGLSNEH